jgi:flagellin-like hook-associated protein FlgL
VPATDTLGALGFYVNQITGISAPPVPATVYSTAAYPPGVGAIVAGVNDQFSIQLGARSSIDGRIPDPVTLTLTPGAYGTAAALAAEINNQISLSADLKNVVLAVVRPGGPPDYVDIQTVNTGSRVQADDLILSDVIPGTLANLGLTGPTTPGGGSAAGQGIIEEPQNIVDTIIQIRDELFGYAARGSRLTDLVDVDSQSLGLFPGSTIRIWSDGSYQDVTVQRFTTMDDLADQIERKLGFQLEVNVLRDGRIEVFNPTTTVINDIRIEAFDSNNNHIQAFEKMLEPIQGKLVYRSQLTSETLYEDDRFQNLTTRIGDVDDGFETILSTLAQIGSRTQRMEMTQNQNATAQVNLISMQSANDGADMAQVITDLKEAENVLNAALGIGARVIPPSLFDFLE